MYYATGDFILSLGTMQRVAGRASVGGEGPPGAAIQLWRERPEGERFNGPVSRRASGLLKL